MMELFNEKPLSRIKAEREAQVRQMLEENSVDVYAAVAGLFEWLISVEARLTELEKGGK